MRVALALLLAVAVLAWPTPVSAQAGAISTEQYAGVWKHRNAILTITRNGHGVYEWKVGQWCGPTVPFPCDPSVSEWGGLGSITFTSMSDNRLIGIVDWASDESAFTDHAIEITFQPNGLADLREGNSTFPRTLCGPTTSQRDRVYWGC